MTIPIRWFFAEENAKLFPGHTVFGSGNWASDKLSWPGPGEVLGAPRPWRDGSYPPWQTFDWIAFYQGLRDRCYVTITEVRNAGPDPLGFVGQKMEFNKVDEGLLALKGPMMPQRPGGPGPLHFYCNTPPGHDDLWILSFGLQGGIPWGPGNLAKGNEGQFYVGPLSAFEEGATWPAEPLAILPGGQCLNCGFYLEIPIFNVGQQYNPPDNLESWTVRFTMF